MKPRPIILAVIFFVLFVIAGFYLLSEKPVFSPEGTTNPEVEGKTVFTLDKTLLNPEEGGLTNAEQRTATGEGVKSKNIGMNYGIEDSTDQGNVRSATLKAGVEYKVSERSAFGVEAGRKAHDSQDAAAWNESTQDENSAQAKYKLSF